jgi:hypothetical protein
MNAARDTLSVVRIGRDSVLRFQQGDWVEVTDDVQEFSGLSGDMCQVTVVDDVQLTITVAPPLPAGKYDATNPKHHTRVIRWDQKGIVRDPLGNVIVDVDTNGGLIPVPLASTVVLEDGVQVTFTTDPLTGLFHVADYWCFAARTIDASVELLDHAPPRGILHHFARLAIVTFAGGVPTGTPTDCRTFWPPSFGGTSCDCTACVSADGHNSGAFTIQMAINQVKATGGKVCLGPGTYTLTDTVQLSGNSVRVTGRGMLATVLVQPAGRPAMLIGSTGGESANDLAVEELQILMTPTATPAAGSQNPAFVVMNAVDVLIQRCVVAPPSGIAATDPAIALSGGVLEAILRDNILNAFAGIVDWQPAWCRRCSLLTCRSWAISSRPPPSALVSRVPPRILETRACPATRSLVQRVVQRWLAFPLPAS